MGSEGQRRTSHLQTRAYSDPLKSKYLHRTFMRNMTKTFHRRVTGNLECSTDTEEEEPMEEGDGETRKRRRRREKSGLFGDKLVTLDLEILSQK